MTAVKICGIQDLPSARAAIQAGAALLGINFHPPSPRFLAPHTAAELVVSIRDEFGSESPTIVGIFVEQTPVKIIETMALSGVDAAQLTGKNSHPAIADLADRAYVAIRPRDAEEAGELVRQFRQDRETADPLPAILVDSYHSHQYGGTGELTALSIAAAAIAECDRVMLAGGLTPLNVAARIKELQPWGVDVASGVESTVGEKDVTLIQQFIAAVHTSETQRFNASTCG